MVDRVALLQDGLVLVGDDGALPSFEAAEDLELAQALTLVGAEIPLAPTMRLPDGSRVHVVGMRDGAERADARGALVAPAALADGAVAAAIAQAVAELDPARTPAGRPDWYRPGWYEAIETWIDGALLPSGRRRTGPIEPVKAWSVSAVARVPVEGDAVWVKQPCAHFHAEARIHRAVAALVPELVPQLIATEVDRGWLLMEPMAGAEEAQHAAGAALRVAERWADAQIAAVEQVPALLAAGLPHRGLELTVTGFRALLEHSTELALLDAVELAAIRGSADRAIELVRELWHAGVPDTLAHGDLHLDNVAWDGETLRLFDWTDGCVSHPFLDIAHLTRFMGVRDEAAAFEAAYASRWREAFPEADTDRALELAPLADLVFQVVTFDEIAKATEPVSAWELGGVVAKKLRHLPAMVSTLA
ncbi:Phosphotransferase enzyme family protein [Agrococcus baldri]|uniref:Phosphotransferase enzyme family protein n=1 Tax=Agrococcus baldri TaxID=153730 RepID=A0AA94HM70_9MICO|nr:aminoglycoside phosphotransferase family protein [Agrococcus baldri]SFS09798.1 Phosphotransferase enzyme family protein [Agrococcus baldri]